MKKVAIDWRPLRRELLHDRQISQGFRQACDTALSRLARYVEGQGYEGPLDLARFYENDDGSYDPIDGTALLGFFQWVREEYKPPSYNETLVAMRYILRVATGKRKLNRNPMPRLRELRLPRRHQDVFTIEEFERLQQAALHGPQPERDLCMLGLCITVGPRPAELRQLRPEDVAVQLSSVKFLRAVKTFEAASALKSDVKQLLRVYHESPLYQRRVVRELFVDDQGQAFTPKVLSKWLNDLYARADVHKNGGLYVFRRSMATIAHQARMSTAIISRQLRHERLETTGRYINVEYPWDEMLEAVEKGVRNLHL